MKLLVRGTNWVGDAVMTIPALRELRRILPDSQITLLSRSWADGIFHDVDFIDGILPLDETSSLLKQSKLLRGHKFDAVILFTNSFKSALLARLGRITKRFGYAKEGRSILLSNSYQIPKWKNEKHEIFYYLNLVSEFEKDILGTNSVSKREPKFDLQVSNERKEQAKEILVKNGADLSKKTIAFVAGSTNSRAKRWGSENYSGLNDLIQSQIEANVILIGAPDEVEIAIEVESQSSIKPIVLAGKTSLSEVTAILSISDLLVSNDTGPAHISAALGTKTIVIFGPTNPKTTYPWNSEIVREEDIECSPCMLRDCPIDHRCMTRISPEKVFEKVRMML